jgi:hypothetical protein
MPDWALHDAGVVVRQMGHSLVLFPLSPHFHHVLVAPPSGLDDGALIRRK